MFSLGTPSIIFFFPGAENIDYFSVGIENTDFLFPGDRKYWFFSSLGQKIIVFLRISCFSSNDAIDAINDTYVR